MTIQNQITSFGQGNVDALVKSSTVAVDGFKEIGTAISALLTQSTTRATTAVQTLLAVKSPTELPTVVVTLAKANVASAVADGRKIQELVTSIATNSFAPLSALFNVVQAPVAAKKVVAEAA